MVFIEDGSLLLLDLLVAENFCQSAFSNRASPTSTVVETHNLKRLSTCDVRLSFGDESFSKPIERDVRPSEHLPQLNKFDKLLLGQLFCPKHVEATKDVGDTVVEDCQISHRSSSQPDSCRLNYRIRGTSENGDEFLIIQDNAVIYGSGIDSKYRNVEAVFTESSPVVDAIWCQFRYVHRHVKSENVTVTPTLELFPHVDAVCVAEQRKIHFHRKDGEHYAHATSFPMRKLWSFPLGLLVERDPEALSNLAATDGYPNIFSATTHLEELSPVLFLEGPDKPVEQMTLLPDPKIAIVGVADSHSQLPMVLTFEPSENRHSLWLVRVTSVDEIDCIHHLLEKPGNLHFHGSYGTPLTRSNNKSQTGSGGSSSFVSPLTGTPPVRRPVFDSTTKNVSLHRTALMSASKGLLPRAFDESSPSPLRSTVHTTPGNGGSTGNREDHTPTSAQSSSAVIPMDMSISLSGSEMSPFGLGLPNNKFERTHRSSPNVSAHSLKDLRSPAMTFSKSKAMAMLSPSLELSSASHTHKSTRLGASHHTHQSDSKVFARLTHPFQSAQVVTDELASPKLAFVRVWDDSKITPKKLGPAEGAFLVTDHLRQTYFCFLLPLEQVLRCIKLNYEYIDNSQSLKIACQGVTNIPATSAVKIADHYILILTPSGKLKLFSGPTCELFDVNLASQAPDDVIVLPVSSSPNQQQGGPTASSPLVKSLHQLILSPNFSPVPNVGFTPPVASTNKSNIEKLVFCGRTKFLAETPDGLKVFRIPLRVSTDVIELCLNILLRNLDCNIFSRLFLTLTKDAMDSRKDLKSLQDRWDTFFIALLSTFGCKVTAAAPVQQLIAKSTWESLSQKGIVLGLQKKFGVIPETIADLNSFDFKITVPSTASIFSYAEGVLMAIHLVAEETRLCMVWRDERKCMLPWLGALAEICGRSGWVEYYTLEYYALQLKDVGCSLRRIPVSFGNRREMQGARRLPERPPNLLESLSGAQNGMASKYPVADGLNPLSRKIILLVAMLANGGEQASSSHIVDVLKNNEFTIDDFRYLPQSLQVAFQSVFASLCLQESFENLPAVIYEIANRQDGVFCKHAVNGAGFRDFCAAEVQQKTLSIKSDSAEALKKRSHPLPHSLITKRFASDARVREAERLLVTSEPVTIPLNSMHATNEVEFRKSQEAWLKSVAARTMSLPVARGMLSLRSEFAYATEKLQAPDMVYSGLERGSGRKISLKNDELPAGHDFWPRFHNGVATGLRLRHYDQDSIKFDHHWLAFNAGQHSKRESVEYAGIFLGMALNGLIDPNTDPVELHNLLVRLEDSVSIAVILGMACLKRGTQDKRYYRMIGLHIVTFMPETGIELIIPQNIHVASLLSLGLLYRASANRFISERLLAEIWTGGASEGTDSISSVMNTERESSSLSAAVGLGFVLLGLGNESVLGLADLEIPQRLRTFMVGGLHGKPSVPRKPENSSARSREDDQSINIHITASGAILALAMIYMKTERSDIADWMAMPKTLQELDEIRPDFLLLRVVARALIMWTSVEATEKWVNSNFPNWILKNVFMHTSDLERENHDVISLTQAYFFILAGASMSLGLKFAGTASVEAKTLLLKIATMMTKWAEDTTLVRRCSLSLTQTCLTTIMIALASVMAGTGDLEVFRVLRYMHGRSGGPRTSITYGHQMGMHIAIGLLFLGCGMYTLGTSNEALAAMLVAFFPMWPKTPGDNRYHLQAFRHLYVLAVENRLIMTKSLHGGDPVQAVVRVTYTDTVKRAAQTFTTPCVLPEFSGLKRIAVGNGNHWLVFTGENNWADLKKLLLGGGLIVSPSKLKNQKDSDNAGLRKVTNDDSNVTVHMNRYLLRPINDTKRVLDSIKRFLREYDVLCNDRGVAGLFEISSRRLLSQKKDDLWIPWVLYECVTYDHPDAFMEVLAFSKESDKLVSRIAWRLLRFGIADAEGQMWKWKKRLLKTNFNAVGLSSCFDGNPDCDASTSSLP